MNRHDYYSVNPRFFLSYLPVGVARSDQTERGIVYSVVCSCGGVETILLEILRRASRRRVVGGLRQN